MEETYKVYAHNPPHLFRPSSKYFITGSTYLKKHFLTPESSKRRLLDSIVKGCEKYNWVLEDWVILNNHYHLMLNAPDKADTLGAMFKEVHKFTAMWLQENFPELKDEKKIFYNYWDSCITFEKSYFARLNYIYYNPVKHGYIKEAGDYLWSSYRFRLKEEFNYLNEIKEKYPWDKVKVKDDF
ncbi:MAG: transposase [candidate division Zixibacteria bacterium]|nr:transposase [candidate division Zixibacteria bacterium]